MRLDNSETHIERILYWTIICAKCTIYSYTTVFENFVQNVTPASLTMRAKNKIGV